MKNYYRIMLGAKSMYADKFVGELILFGGEKYPDWKSVIKYLVF